MLRLAWVYAAVSYLPWPASLCAALGLCARRGRRRFGVALGWLPAAAIAAGLGVLDRPAPAPTLPAEGTAVHATVWIAQRPTSRGERSSTWAQVEALVGGDSLQPIPSAKHWRGVRLRLNARGRLPAYGRRCNIKGRLRTPRPARNFSGFNERRFVLARGGAAVLDAEQVTMLDGDRGPAWRRRVSEPMREWVRAQLRGALAAREAALLAALVLGVRDGLDAQLQDGWRGLGMSHVLALSGLHVGLVAGALLWIVRTPRRRSGFLVLLAGVGAYTALGGLGPSVVRAAAMATWMACAVHIGRRRSPMTALVYAGALLVLDAPQRALDLRFQLSCLATLGILVWLPALARLTRVEAGRTITRLMRRALGVCGVGLAAQAATLPVIVSQFGFLSWASPLANLTLVPIVGLALLLTLAGLPAQCISESLGRPLWLVAAALLHAVLRVTDMVPAYWDPRLFVPASSSDVALAWLVCAATLTAGACAASGRRRSAWGALAAALFLACLLGLGAARPRPPVWELVGLDVGQGDALLVHIGAHAWLVDAGDERPTDMGARTIVPHLRRAGIRRLRGLVLTHPHRDHYGGAASVLAALPVDTVYVAKTSIDAPAYAAIRAAAPDVPWRGLAAGDAVLLAPNFTAEVLWPQESDVLDSGPNGASLVLWARGDGMPDLLAMGDLEADGEELLLRAARPALNARAAACLVLKVGHHGSRTSSTPDLLAAADPELALISAGVHNRFGHPADETLGALRARGCAILRTDRGGAVRLRLRGQTLWLERPGQAPRALRLDSSSF